MRARELRLAPPSAPWLADFDAETSAGSKLLHNNSNKLKRRPRFRPGISARWLRACKDAGIPSIDRNLAGILIFAVIQAKRLSKNRSDSGCPPALSKPEIADFRGRTDLMPRAPRGFPLRVFRGAPAFAVCPTRLWTPSSSVDTRGCALGADQGRLIPDFRVRLEDLAHVKSAGPRI